MRVAVVGGGISGLLAAHRLLGAGVEVLLLEASASTGGILRTARVGGVDLDVGAESAIDRGSDEGVAALITELGLPLVRPTGARSAILIDGRLVPIPPQILGIPAAAAPLSSLLTQEGLRRAADEANLPTPPFDGDVAIGRLVDERFGPEVTDRLLEPMLGGIYAGHARELSFQAVQTSLYDRARAGGPLSAHAAAMLATSRGVSPFVGTPGGMGRLADTLARWVVDHGGEIRTRTPVRALTREPDGRWRIRSGPVPAPHEERVDRVLLATPTAATARLVRGLDPTAADLLAAVPTASVAVLSLVVSRAQLSGSGLLVPPGMLPTIKAFTHSSLKWDWVDERVRDRHGAGAQAIRISVGRAGQERVLQLDDDALVARTVAEARSVPGWAAAEVVAQQVQRWGGALPQYTVGHAARAVRAAERIRGLGGLALAGSHLSGVGIASCLTTARRAVSALLSPELDQDHPDRDAPDRDAPAGVTPTTTRSR